MPPAIRMLCFALTNSHVTNTDNAMPAITNTGRRHAGLRQTGREERRQVPQHPDGPDDERRAGAGRMRSSTRGSR